MKRSNRLVILVGVLLAVLAFVGIVILLNQAPEQAASRTRTVLVAAENIDIDEEVTPDKVEEAQVEPGDVQGTPIGSVSGVSGERAIVAIPAGAQVNKERLGLVGGVPSLSDQLLLGEKAVAFQVDRVTGLDFLLTPGDRIDIVVAQTIQVLQRTADSVDSDVPRFEPVQGLESARTVKAVLQNKRVLYVSGTRIQAETDTEAPPADGQPAPQLESVVIVFAGTDQDAELIKFAQNDNGVIGALSITIRSAEDDVVEITTGMTIDILVEQYGLTIPSIVEQVLETP